MKRRVEIGSREEATGTKVERKEETECRERKKQGFKRRRGKWK